MKKVLNENRVLFVLAIIIFICLVAIIIGLISYFYNFSGEKYGTRLEGIEKYSISKNIDKEIVELISANLESVNVDAKGKIIYVILDVSDKVSREDAQNIAIKSLEAFTEDLLGYYDIQFMITCKNASEENSIYPFEGYKNSNSNQVIWTNVKG